MTDPEKVRYLADSLRKLADVIEEHPPSFIDMDVQRVPPVEYVDAGVIEYIPREGLESVGIAVRW